MKRPTIFKLLSITLCIVLIAATALMTSGCNDNAKSNEAAPNINDASKAEVVNIGEGDTQFDFTVIDKQGNVTKFKVATNKTIVGEALLDAKLIEGEAGPYGLYVKTVNGITLDFDADGMYWAFYVNDKYATGGVDTTQIKSGETYTFKAEK